MSFKSDSFRKSSAISTSLKGIANIPGDKSISHRALILGSLAVGETRIQGLLESIDVMHTADAMRQFGSEVKKNNDSTWSVFGVGVGGYQEPKKVIDCGNSGTAIRLIMGAISTSPITATFTGDKSLNSRPMERVLKPLGLFGAQSLSRSSGLLPLTLRGAENPGAIEYSSNVASAQVKSAVLLGALNSFGTTVYREPRISRDHTEKMLVKFGANINVDAGDNCHRISIDGPIDLLPQNISVPSDPSSAAFPICAALMVPNSQIVVPNVCNNPTRNGLILTLREMGANIKFKNERLVNGEQVVDMEVSHTPLMGVEVPAKRVVSMIDEFPILAAVASVADGKTIMTGISELRVKESDRISAMSKGLTKNGIEVVEEDDSLTVFGKGFEGCMGGGMVETFFDHRIAMAFLCLGLVSKNRITIDDYRSIQTSFPSFFEIMVDLGASFR